MLGHSILSPGEVRSIVSDLRGRMGLFSFERDHSEIRPIPQDDIEAAFGIRPGGIVEWVVTKPGAGVTTSSLHVMAQSSFNHGVWAIVDSSCECYAAALPGWGVSLGRVVMIRPSTRRDLCWAVEQCLRCPGVSATWAWVDRGVPEKVHRRWHLAAEVGGGVGLFFRPDSARREPAWADLRLLATPRGRGRGDARRLRIDVLYRRGGLGGSAQV